MQFFNDQLILDEDERKKQAKKMSTEAAWSFFLIDWTGVNSNNEKIIFHIAVNFFLLIILLLLLMY